MVPSYTLAKCLLDILEDDSVVGVARLSIYPAFQGPTVCTLIYRASNVEVEIVDAQVCEHGTFTATVTKPYRYFRKFGPLASWDKLRKAAFSALSCMTLTADGVSYRHALLDWHGGMEAKWSNPAPHLHANQLQIIDGYEALISSSGMLLHLGMRVRIRSGLMAGFIGRISQLDRYRDRFHIIVDLGGKDVSVSLSIREIEFVEEQPDGSQ